jgi:hypothetical protein
MKKMVLISLVSLVLNLVALNAQKPLSDLSKAPLMMVLKNNSVSTYPVRFEESDSTRITRKNGDTTRIEYFVRYTDRGKAVRGGVRKTRITKDKISIWQNDTLRVEVKRQSEQHTGTLGGIKGKVIRELIPSQHPTIHATEQYMFQDDKLYFIIYRPELGLVELESSKDFQYRRMIGNFFTDVCKYPSGGGTYTELNRTLTKGDELQILFNFQRLNEEGTEFISIPDRILKIKLGEFLPYSDPTKMNFESEVTDLANSTVFDETSGVIEFFEEGFAINQQIYLRDSLYPRTIRIFAPDAENRVHPFYPAIDLSGSLIEASYEHERFIGQTKFQITSYWNSSGSNRLSFLPEFAFPWRDNAENYQGNPVYLKLGTKIHGKPYESPENEKPHFSRVQVSQDSLFLEVFSDLKQNITIELQQVDGTTIKQLKQSHGIREGITRIPFEKLDLTYGSQVDIVLITKVNDEAIEHQRFRYIQNN